MDEREKEIREEAECELDLIKANPWRTEPTLKFKLEDVCHLLSIIDNLREKFKPHGEEVITRKQALSALDTLNASMREATKVFKTLIDQHFHLVEKKPQVMKLTLGDPTGTVPARVVLNLQYQLNDIQNEIDALLEVKP